MLPTQRRQAILAQVRQHSAVSADDLSRQFGVSVETIRRDLRRLGDKGLRRSRRMVSTETPNWRARSSAETALCWRTWARIAWRR